MLKFYSYRSIFILGLSILFFSCSTSRHIESSQRNAVYLKLGLSSDRNDNFALYQEAASWLHIPYKEAGSSRAGTDCSFLVNSIYKAVYNKNIERNSEAMMTKNCEIIPKNKLREGDLVFFNTGSRPGWHITHVGIYLKENKFLHSSTQSGVHISDLNENYYLKAWVCAGRVK